MAHRRTSTQAGSRSGELSGIGRVGWSVEEFGASCGELAGPKETAGRQQGKCYCNPVLHREEPLEGCCTPRQSPPQSVIVPPGSRANRKSFRARSPVGGKVARLLDVGP